MSSHCDKKGPLRQSAVEFARKRQQGSRVQKVGEARYVCASLDSLDGQACGFDLCVDKDNCRNAGDFFSEFWRELANELHPHL